MSYPEFSGRESQYKNEFFLSKTEAAWAAYFDLSGIAREHEPETFEFPGMKFESFDIPPTMYTPDFYLPDHDTYVEVKNGINQTEGAAKIGLLARHTGKAGMLVDGMPHNASIYLFSPDKTNPTRLSNPYYCDINFHNFEWIPPEGHRWHGLVISRLIHAPSLVRNLFDAELLWEAKALKKEMRENRTKFEKLD